MILKWGSGWKSSNPPLPLPRDVRRFRVFRLNQSFLRWVHIAMGFYPPARKVPSEIVPTPKFGQFRDHRAKPMMHPPKQKPRGILRRSSIHQSDDTAGDNHAWQKIPYKGASFRSRQHNDRPRLPLVPDQGPLGPCARNARAVPSLGISGPSRTQVIFQNDT